MILYELVKYIFHILWHVQEIKLQLKFLQKKVHNGSENKKKYGVAEKLAKKYHDLGPNGIVHNSG